jgi:hypothetical protein
MWSSIKLPTKEEKTDVKPEIRSNIDSVTLVTFLRLITCVSDSRRNRYGKTLNTVIHISEFYIFILDSKASHCYFQLKQKQRWKRQKTEHERWSPTIFFLLSSILFTGEHFLELISVESFPLFRDETIDKSV